MSETAGVKKYPHLFMPVRIGGQIFRNRIFASPTGYLNTNGDGFLNDGAYACYARKAQGGAASVATFEGVVDGELGRATPRHIALDNPMIGPNLARLAYGVRQYGAVATLELTHAGMFANRDLAMFGGAARGAAYGPVSCVYGGREITGMTEEIIERTIQKFVDAALLAKRCGFGMVLVHAGHGWMLHQFLSPVTNTRTDRWGGPSAEDRCRMLVTIIDRIHAACGRDFPVEVRISGSEMYDGGYGLDEGIRIAEQIDGHADLIHVSAGNHEVDEVFSVTHPSMFREDGCNVFLAAEIKKHVKTPVATVGALGDPALMEEIIASGKADIVEVGRQFIADPDFVSKIRTGSEDRIRKCMRCFSCFSNLVTVAEPYCAVNPESGRELELRWAPAKADVVKKVLVAGGGVGGMQAALTCASMGHSVILCEKGSRLGGVLRCEENVDFKRKLREYLDLQERLCLESPDIDVRLNTEVTKEYAESVRAGVIIAATGTTPVIPRIRGIEGSNVFSVREAYAAEELGGKVVIIGAGLAGIELGLHLRSRGVAVDVVEQLDRISDGGNLLHMSGVRAEIRKRGLNVHLSTAVREITADAVLCTDSGGRELRFGADSVVYATGQKPAFESAAALYACAPEFYMVGDCLGQANIASATSSAYMAALNAGRKY